MEKGTKSPGGRLKKYLNKWRSDSESSHILEVVENGYRKPFKQIPPSVCLNQRTDSPESRLEGNGLEVFTLFLFKSIKSIQDTKKT